MSVYTENPRQRRFREHRHHALKREVRIALYVCRRYRESYGDSQLTRKDNGDRNGKAAV